MNDSGSIPEDSAEIIIARITSTFGGVTFLANTYILICIIKLLAGVDSKKDKYGIIIHTFFVCINDTVSGLALFLTGMTRVYGKTTAYMCAYLVFTCFSLQIVSQGNLTCICAQRYVLTRKIRNNNVNQRAFYKKTLIVVNVFIGLVSLVVYILGTEVDTSYVPTNGVYCRLSSVMNGGNSAIIGSMNFALGAVFIIVSDILCMLTILGLKARVAPARAPTTNEGGSSENINSNVTSEVQNSTKIRQDKAIFTLLLIVIFFNLSAFPITIGYIVIFLRVEMPWILRRFLLIALFFNSLANPFIIATRVQEIRLLIVNSLRNCIASARACSFRGN